MKDKKGKGVFNRNKVEKHTGAFYDPDAKYGRTKKQPYYATEKGRFDAQANKEDFYQWTMGKAGGIGATNPTYGGATPFGQFLQNEYFDNLQTGYNAARGQSGGRLEFIDYMRGLGWNAKRPGANDFGAATAVGAPNPFTSASMTTPAASRTPRRPARPGMLPMGSHPVTPQPIGGTGVDHARRAFLSLMPMQRGAATPSTAYQPGRWSTF